MNEMKLTLELSAEDRDRLDAILTALGNITVLTALGNTEKKAIIKGLDDCAPQDATEVEPTKVPKIDFEKAAKKVKEIPAPDARTIKSLAVKKIQAGYREKVKGLIASYGQEKVDMIPEDKRAAFMADLEKIGG